jgi:hypothetical protein
MKNEFETKESKLAVQIVIALYDYDTDTQALEKLEAAHINKHIENWVHDYIKCFYINHRKDHDRLDIFTDGLEDYDQIMTLMA